MSKYFDSSKINIELKLIDNEVDYNIAKEIVEKHHSYVPTFSSVGRRIDWLILVDGKNLWDDRNREFYISTL